MSSVALGEGVIATVVEARGFGFISREGERDLFFHIQQLDRALAFDKSLVGLKVTFGVEQTKKGERAIGVRRA